MLAVIPIVDTFIVAAIQRRSLDLPNILPSKIGQSMELICEVVNSKVSFRVRASEPGKEDLILHYRDVTVPNVRVDYITQVDNDLIDKIVEVEAAGGFTFGTSTMTIVKTKDTVDINLHIAHANVSINASLLN